MSGISPLALALILLAVCFAGDGRLLARDPLGDAPPVFGADSTPSAQPVWLDDTSDPRFLRLPPVNEPPIVDDPQFAPSPGGSRLDVGAPREGGRVPFTARLWWIPQQTLKNQPQDLGMNGEELELAFPVRIDSDGIWLALGSVQRLEISTSAVLPDSGLAVPDQLWDIQVGTMHIRQLANGWRAGGMLRVGSPSDQPFAAVRDMTVTLLGFLTIPSGPRDAWNFSLFYSPTGQIVWPIPGVAYVWRPSHQFQANLGIPFSLEYRPIETMTVTASYLPLNHVQVLVRQALGEFWSIYGGYRTVTETFLLADRLHDRERTYIFDQRLTLGTQRKLARGWSLDLSAAYVFDRHIFQAEKFSGSRRDELAIAPGVAGTLQLLWTR
ncbi:MAG TPA: hypothetical protein PLF81_32210 [Candidatus Anammoximicrobium sp.]|nr:hypothetical protein [Candidatus Anammoximicrobium sp.]